MRPEVLEALKRGGVVWVALDGGPERAVWHVWHDDAVLLVVGGPEQELPGAERASSAVVVVRDRAALGGRLEALSATVERLAPRSAEWEAAVRLLAAERLNAPDVAGLPDRWAAGSTVLRLLPG